MRNFMAYRVLTIVTGALLLAATVFVLIRWSDVPDQIPTHYNFAGQPDDYGSKGFIIFEIVMAWFLYVLLTVVARFPRTWNMPVKVTAQNKDKLYSITRFMLEVIKLLCVLMFILIIMSAAMSEPLAGWPIMVLVGIMLVVTAGGIILMYRYK